MSTAELATSYAALILADDGIEITVGFLAVPRQDCEASALLADHGLLCRAGRQDHDDPEGGQGRRRRAHLGVIIRKGRETRGTRDGRSNRPMEDQEANGRRRMMLDRLSRARTSRACSPAWAPEAAPPLPLPAEQLLVVPLPRQRRQRPRRRKRVSSRPRQICIVEGSVRLVVPLLTKMRLAEKEESDEDMGFGLFD